MNARLRLLAVAAVAAVAADAYGGEWKPTPAQPAGGRGLEVSVSRNGDSPMLFACVKQTLIPPYPAYIYRSCDYGDHWFPVFSNGRLRTVRAVVDDPNTVYCGGSGVGIFKSTDGGESWVPRNSGIGDLDIGTIAIAPPMLTSFTEEGAGPPPSDGSIERRTAARTG
jgi:hypothetical protein